MLKMRGINNMSKHNKQNKEVEVKPQISTSESVNEVKEPEVPTIDTEEEITQSQPEEIKEKPVVKSNVPEVKYRQVVYLGIAKEAERIGAVTGNQIIFHKDKYGMPEPTQVDERDYAGLIAEKGKGCARRDASILFMSKMEWDLELEQARIANNS